GRPPAPRLATIRIGAPGVRAGCTKLKTKLRIHKAFRVRCTTRTANAAHKKENGDEMSESVNLPALGESVTEGTVTRWLKQVGDRVEVDEPLLEVSTDKVDTEIPSPFAGVIEEILVAEDETADVGSPLVRIGDGSGSGQAAEEAHAEEAPAEEPQQEAPAQEAPQQDEPQQEAPAEEAPAAGSGEGTEVTLPALGESVTEGTVTRWLKQVGDTVEVDEP